VSQPLQYQLHCQRLGRSILAQGTLRRYWTNVTTSLRMTLRFRASKTS
jgi:hypothetical protein